MMKKALFIFIGLLLSHASLASESWNKEEIIGFLQHWQSELKADQTLESSEKLARREFLERLIFEVDEKTLSYDTKKDLSECLDDMAYVDELSSNKIYGSHARFLKNLKMALKEILEPHENILKFVKTYTEFSSITDPIDPDEFADLRSYSNGVTIEVAHPMDLDEAANLAEEKLNTDQIPDHDWLDFKSDLQKEFEIKAPQASLSRKDLLRFEYW